MVTSNADVNTQRHDGRAAGQLKPSIDEWLLSVLHQQGTQTLDHIGTLLPDVNWAHLFVAIDRLNRTGDISLWSPGFGDYHLTVNQGQRLTT